MNQLAMDILELMSKRGINEDQDKVLEQVIQNLDRVKFCKKIDQCKDCVLHKSTSHKTLGSGPRNTPLMIIGDYSGEIENATGIPFSGPEGKLLDTLLFDACVEKKMTYITNCIKCHTPYNRNPDVTELSACASNFLAEELTIIKPKHIVAMGDLAASLFTSNPLSEMRGKTIEARGYFVTFTYSPKYILSQKNEAYDDSYNFIVDDFSRVITDIIEKYDDKTICRPLTAEESSL